jgi:hypothetical protein
MKDFQLENLREHISSRITEIERFLKAARPSWGGLNPDGYVKGFMDARVDEVSYLSNLLKSIDKGEEIAKKAEPQTKYEEDLKELKILQKDLLEDFFNFISTSETKEPVEEMSKKENVVKYKYKIEGINGPFDSYEEAQENAVLMIKKGFCKVEIKPAEKIDFPDPASSQDQATRSYVDNSTGACVLCGQFH